VSDVERGLGESGETSAGLTGCNQVIDNDNALVGLDSVSLHLEGVLHDNDIALRWWSSQRLGYTDTYRAILLLVAGADALTGKFSSLADGDERSTEARSDQRSEKKSTRVEADDDIDGFCGRKCKGMWGDVVHKVGDEDLEGFGIAQDGEDIKEDDTLSGDESRSVNGKIAPTFLGKSEWAVRQLLMSSTSAMVIIIGRGIAVDKS
jgi:hypothetical protein